jgi:hypothetical protein
VRAGPREIELSGAARCNSRNIYREKVTGARADRRELLRMLDRLVPGDVVTVTRASHIARSASKGGADAGKLMAVPRGGSITLSSS